jgi:hypothetical protein
LLRGRPIAAGIDSRRRIVNGISAGRHDGAVASQLDHAAASMDDPYAFHR